MDLSPVTLEGSTIRLEPLGLHHVDPLSAVGLDPSLWALTTIRVASRDDMRRYLMLRHAFEVLACRRVELKTSALNSRSRAAMLRIGATEEGTLRRHMVNPDGSARDSVYFSIIDDEWPAVRQRLEGMLRR